MSARVIVLKFGGSVLEYERSLGRAVHEIYRWRREGLGVVAVVSAFHGETDRLLARSRALGGGAHSTAAAAATGESLAAALLGAALDRAGVPACVLSPAAIRLLAEGEAEDAAPIAVDTVSLAGALDREGVVVVPGFAGIDRRGRTVLLGRGGSDLSALFLAHALGARCRLIKDVDGLYEWDPAHPDARGRPRRFELASWSDALATDGRILQHRAVRFAREHALEFEVARAGASVETRVGPEPAAFAAAATPVRPLRLALLGLGTVGGGVWHLARELPDEFEIAAVVCRDRERARAFGVEESLLHADAGHALCADVDVVVECLGGLEPARGAIAAALALGRDVVSANKRVLAEHGDEFAALARARGASLRGSAAVGGSAPILERVAACRREAILVRGVLSGSVNFVLERVGVGESLPRALEAARELGLTESDPARDLDGRDAADKLTLIAEVLGASRIGASRIGASRIVATREALDEHVARRALDAHRRGMRLRQLAEVRLDARGVRASVRFQELDDDDALFDLPGASNAAEIVGAHGVLDRAIGTGAGRWPTAQSILGDLQQLAREHRSERARGELRPSARAV